MKTAARTAFSLLLFLGLVHLPESSVRGEVEDLLPPPVRRLEQRSIGEEERRRYSPFDVSLGAAFSPDGRLLVTSAANQGLVWWDVRTGRLLERTGNLGHQQALAAAFTPDGKRLVATSWGGYQDAHPVTLWDAATRQRLRSLDEDVNDTPFSAAAIAPDGKTIAFAASSSQRKQASGIVFWDPASGDEIGKLDGLIPLAAGRGFGVNHCQALTYSPDGRTLAALLEGRVLLIELATGKKRGEMAFTAPPPRPQMNQPQQQHSGALAFSPDGRTLAVGCPDGAIRRFDLRTGRTLSPLPGHRNGVVALCWPADGKRILSYGQRGDLVVWRARPEREWQAKPGPLTDAALQELWSVLRGDDPLDIYGCVQVMAAAPDQTLPFLRKRLSAVPKADTERIDRLIADLQKGDYNARKRSVVELRKIGSAAAPALAQAQQRGYDPLFQRLVFEFANLAPPADQLRATRALRVLERIGNADAAKLLKELAGGAAQAPLTVQAKAVLDRLGKTDPTKPEKPEKPEVAWKALAGEDSMAAYRAIRALAAQPTSATLLCDRLKETAAKQAFDDNPKRIAKLLTELDSEVFAEREQASKALQDLGNSAVAAIRKALAETDNLEVKRRLEKLIAQAAKGLPPPLLLAGRILETLELMGGSEARQALLTLQKDVQGAWLRQAVSESLRRQQEEKK
jgi:hypothetical protein